MPKLLGSAVAALVIAEVCIFGAAFAQAPDDEHEPGDTGIRAADPSIIRTDDGYVAVESRDGRTLFVRLASILDGLSDAPAVRVWSDTEGLGEVWAPEIDFRGGRYEIYFAGGIGRDHRMYRIDSVAPAADYGQATELGLPDDKWAIDGLPLTLNGVDYFVWSGWQGNTDVRQDLFIARMSDTGTVEPPRVRIGTTDRRWENVAGELPSINEGPQPIVDPAGQLHVTYSANGSWGENYCIADLRLKADGDPLDADAWFESPGCLFGANPATLAEGATLATKAKGVGHHSFILPGGHLEPDGEAGGPMPFFYHGVPVAEEPDDFWAARKWFIGTYQWQADVTYRSSSGSDAGWGIQFAE